MIIQKKAIKKATNHEWINIANNSCCSMRVCYTVGGIWFSTGR